MIYSVQATIRKLVLSRTSLQVTRRSWQIPNEFPEYERQNSEQQSEAIAIEHGLPFLTQVLASSTGEKNIDD